MLPSCKEIAEQASEDLDQPLTGIRWLKMKCHLFICVSCRRYKEQINLSSKMVRFFSNKTEATEKLKTEVETCYKELHCKHKKKQA